MSILIHACVVLADRSLLRDMGSGFRDRREHFEPIDLWPWVLVVVAIVAGLAFLSRWLNRNDAQGFYQSPRALFRALCHAHGLSRADYRLLLSLARARGIEAPAHLFLRPEAFELGDDDPDDLVQNAEAIDVVAARLFDVADKSNEPQAQGEPTDEMDAVRGMDEEEAAVSEMIYEGSPWPAAIVSEADEPALLDEPAALAAVATSLDELPSAARQKSHSGQAKSSWSTAPSLFEPMPATGPSNKAATSRTKGSADASDDHATTFTEHQAVQALETLMRQINAGRAANGAAEAAATGPQHAPIAEPAPPAGVAATFSSPAAAS